jgi:uncharacterized membrane protein YedE/YeeE
VDIHSIASSTLGGVLIGLGAALLLLCTGRMAGISGIVGGLLRPTPGEHYSSGKTQARPAAGAAASGGAR